MQNYYLKLKILLQIVLGNKLPPEYLLEATRLNNLSLVMILLVEYHLDPNIEDRSTQKTPLYMAAENNNLEMTDFLLRYGALAYSKNKNSLSVENILLKMRKDKTNTDNSYLYPCLSMTLECISAAKKYNLA